MTGSLEVLERLGAALLPGISALLAIFWLATLVAKAERTRCRLATTGLLGSVIWAAAALVPLPRPLSVTPAPVLGTNVLAHVPVGTATATRSPTETLPSPSAPRAGVDARVGIVRADAPLGGVRDRFVSAELGWGELLALLWVLGAIAFATRLLVARLRLRRLRRLAVKAPSIVRAMVGRSAAPAIEVYQVDRDIVPFVSGLRRPRILLPRHIVDAEDRDDLARILAHEVAHVDEGHLWDRLLFALVRPLLWFHPLFYLLRSQAERAAEHVADAIAAGRDPISYAESLMRLMPGHASRAAPSLTSPAYRSKSEFTRRIEMLLKSSKRSTPLTREHPLRRLGQSAGVAALVFVAVAASGYELAQGQGRTQTPRELESSDVATQDLPDPAAKLKERAAKSWQGTMQRMLKDPSLAKEFEALLAKITKRVAEDAKAQAIANMPLPETRSVRVKKGDSIALLALEYLGDASRVHEILLLNPKLDGRRLRVGQKLLLPLRRSAPARPSHSVNDNWEALGLVRQVIELEGKERLLEHEIKFAEIEAERRSAATRLAITRRSRKAVQAALEGELRATTIEIDSLSRQIAVTRGDARLRARLARVEARMRLLREHCGSSKRRKSAKPKQAKESKSRKVR